MVEIEITFGIVCAVSTAVIGFQIINVISQFVYHHFVAFWIKQPIVFQDLGQWAVISGAMNGLGKAFAEEFAKRGMDIVLVDKNELDLTFFAKEIEDKYKVHTMTIQTDFSPSTTTYWDIQRQVANLDIGILVHNVHELQARPERLTDLSAAEIEGALRSVHAVTGMCRSVLPGMWVRRRGMLLVVASLSAITPTPMMTCTAAAKAYCVTLARDLSAELGDRVHVKVLLPAFLHCRWLCLRAPSLLAPSPDMYLRHALPLLSVHERTTGYWVHDVFRAVVNFLHYVHPTYANDVTIEFMELLREISRTGYLND